MSHAEVWKILQQVLDGFSEASCEFLGFQGRSSHLTNRFALVDESLHKLHFFFSETLLLGALDLIDRDSGEHRVHGTPVLPSF